MAMQLSVGLFDQGYPRFGASPRTREIECLALIYRGRFEVVILVVVVEALFEGGEVLKFWSACTK
jgi:hypothetical protein